jgi:hypothetical protein
MPTRLWYSFVFEKKRNKRIAAGSCSLFEGFSIINSIRRHEDSATIDFLQNKRIPFGMRVENREQRTGEWKKGGDCFPKRHRDDVPEEHRDDVVAKNALFDASSHGAASRMPAQLVLSPGLPCSARRLAEPVDGSLTPLRHVAAWPTGCFANAPSACGDGHGLGRESAVPKERGGNY